MSDVPSIKQCKPKFSQFFTYKAILPNLPNIIIILTTFNYNR